MSLGTDMESNIGLMGPTMKDNGFSTKQKVQAHFGTLRAMFIGATLKMIWLTDKENTLILMEVSTKESSKTMYKRATERKSGLTEQSMLVPT